MRKHGVYTFVMLFSLLTSVLMAGASSAVNPSAFPSISSASLSFENTKAEYSGIYNYTVVLNTTMGNIVIGLFDDMPITAGNFENLTQLGYYDDTIFHRVVHSFVIQGGDLSGKGIVVPTIPDELPNKHSNVRGSVAMAKTSLPNSATSQFYINLVDNTFLDSNYVVFGQVIQGMDVVDSIGSVQTDTFDRPLEDVTILDAQLVEHPRTWVVDDDGPADFSTIQEAINAASDGDTVFVKTGTYAHITVDKSVNLCGENRYTTIIDGTAYEEAAILVQASSVNISNFTIQNGKPDLFIGNRQPVITANITIADNIMKDSQEGVIRFVYTSNSILTGNFINGTMAGGGVNFDWANDTWVYNNTVMHCGAAINGGYPSFNNTFQNNNFIDNTYCVFMNNVFDDSRFFHNNFINNSLVHLTSSETCSWDNGYPSGGNYWSNYVGADIFCGASQDETGSDNIGDSPYVIDANNVDNYPLMRPFVPFENQTIYIRADGSVDPSGAPILRKGDVYTLTSSITSNATNGIVVEKDNIVVDGSGFSIEGLPAFSWHGISLVGRSSVTIQNTDIKNFYYGVVLNSSSSNSINVNTITNNSYGIVVTSFSNNNSISGNTITGSEYDGIWLFRAPNNTVCHNNLINNAIQVNDHTPEYANFWDNGCEGNCWSDYSGTDSNNDGIGDTPYVINSNNTDNYPLMNIYWSPCDINHDLKIDMKDIGAAARAFYTRPGDEFWNPHADITGSQKLVPDGKVDLKDIGFIARHFMDHYP